MRTAIKPQFISMPQKALIEDQLSNCTDLLTKDEMIDFFITTGGIAPTWAKTIVEMEYDNYKINPFYNMNWSEY